MSNGTPTLDPRTQTEVAGSVVTDYIDPEGPRTAFLTDTTGAPGGQSGGGGTGPQGPPGPPGAAGPSAITALTSASFVIPAIGSSITVPVTMPWVDAGDTVSVYDGTNQFKGAVLANNGSSLTVLNSGFSGTTSGTMAGGSPISLCSSPDTDIYVLQDDLTFNDSGSGAGPTWTVSGIGIVDLADGVHFGVWDIFQNGGMGLNWPGSALSFTSIQKAVFRAILKASASPETGNSEWIIGLYNSGPYGALFSQAQGFTGLPQEGGGTVDATSGLLAGTYNGSSHIGYKQTGFLPAANQWVDLILVWTPSACRFYCAPEGQIPVLRATLVQNIVTTQQLQAQIGNSSSTTTLYVDRVELVYQTTGNRFRGKRLVGL